MRVVVVFRRWCRRQRNKHLELFFERDLLPSQQLSNGRIVLSQHKVTFERDGKMKVPDLPSDPGGGESCSQLDGKNLLRVLRNSVKVRVVTKETIAMLQGLSEIETEIQAIFGLCPPPSLREGLTINPQ